jgi:hypothetical protein
MFLLLPPALYITYFLRASEDEQGEKERERGVKGERENGGLEKLRERERRGIGHVRPYHLSKFVVLKKCSEKKKKEWGLVKERA